MEWNRLFLLEEHMPLRRRRRDCPFIIPIPTDRKRKTAVKAHACQMTYGGLFGWGSDEKAHFHSVKSYIRELTTFCYDFRLTLTFYNFIGILLTNFIQFVCPFHGRFIDNCEWRFCLIVGISHTSSIPIVKPGFDSIVPNQFSLHIRFIEEEEKYCNTEIRLVELTI